MSIPPPPPTLNLKAGYIFSSTKTKLILWGKVYYECVDYITLQYCTVMYYLKSKCIYFYVYILVFILVKCIYLSYLLKSKIIIFVLFMYYIINVA